jgi:hypothetical protein
MYQIKKFADTWAVFNLDNELSRSLTPIEIRQVSEEFPQITGSDVVSIFVDHIESLNDKP